MYEIIFYLTAAITVLAAGAILIVRHPVHAALYLVISLLSLALIFFLVGAPLLAAFQVMIYAGAIMVLFLLPRWQGVFVAVVLPIRQLSVHPAWERQESATVTDSWWLTFSIILEPGEHIHLDYLEVLKGKPYQNQRYDQLCSSYYHQEDGQYLAISIIPVLASRYGC